MQTLCLLLLLSAAPRIHVHGVVREGSKPVKDAHVSIYLEGQSFGETKTDAKGEFTAEAPKGAHVTAMKGDLMGTSTIEGKEVVVVMKEMPI
jgi:hypothetical protein